MTGIEVCERQGPRKTYPQNWPAYNAAQTTEKEQFMRLLKELCRTQEFSQPPQKRGRPRLPLEDAVFVICFKIFSTLSGRRFICDLRDAHAKGFITKVPHFNSIFNYLENPALTPILQAMIVQSSLPLKEVEVDFAVDSSGFTTTRHQRWVDYKYGRRVLKHWVKVHLMCGVKTNIVTAIEIKERSTNDATQLIPLVDVTRTNFTVHEVLADKGYTSVKNMDYVGAMGAVPYIPFRKGDTPKRGGTWANMFHYFALNREEFLSHYHKRSNVETTFSMIKAKFGGYLRSKTDTAMVNETLCKIICHNICVLIQEAHELGVQIKF